MGFIRIFNKIVKWTLIAVATLFSTVIIFVVFMFLEYVGIIEYNIKNKTDYLILWEWWWNKDSNGESIIDLAEVMPFDWDYFVFYTPNCDIENIMRELDVEADECFEVVLDKEIVFIKNRKVVYHDAWHKKLDIHGYLYPEGLVFFAGDCFYTNKENAKFKAKKNEPGYLILEKIE